MRRAAGFLVALLSVAGSDARAQSAVAEGVFHTMSIGDGTLTELAFPIALSARLGGVRFDANTAFATASYELNGVVSEISGLTDVTVRVMIPMLQDRARIIAAGNIPTGSETLDTLELPVAGVMTTDLLALPVRSFGSGAGVTTGFAYAQPVGSLVFGGIALYRVGGAYEPVTAGPTTQALEFRPGEEFRLRLGVERPVLRGLTWRIAGSWSGYTADELDEEDVFARGDRFIGELQLEFPLLAGSAGIYAWNLYRTESEMMVGGVPQPTPASNLAGLGAQVAYPITATLAIRPQVEAVIQSGDEGYGGGSGFVARAGSGASLRLGALRFEPAVLATFGTFDDKGIGGIMIRGGVLWER